MSKWPDTLPEYVEKCYLCSGEGECEQTYTAGCGGGYYRMKGPCVHCKGIGLKYKVNNGDVPFSVLNQIRKGSDQ